MPPKNKKDAQQEAKRLEEERKKKEEEQARLQQERLKYAAETLPTGLLLPASSQLIIDFPTKTLQFITQKLKDAIRQQYADLLESPRINFIMKELHYFIKDSSEVFGNASGVESAMPHRIMVGCMFSTLVNQDKEGKGEGKSRENDERFLKDIVIKHCQKNQGKAFISKAEGLKILQYASDKYFSRFLLMKMFDKFQKKPIQKSFDLYLETPTAYVNEKTTAFVDLSEKPAENVEAAEGEQK